MTGDEVSVAEAAYGHGVADLDIRAAWRNHWFTSAPYGEDARRYTISRNRSGNYIELVIVAYSQHPLIIHAMSPTPARRKKWRSQLAQERKRP